MMDGYVSKLEDVIKQMLKPIKNIPFPLVIETLAGCKVIPFDDKNREDKALLEKLEEVAADAGAEVNKKGILRSRPNEVGNDIEPFVKNALEKAGFKGRKPKTKNGALKNTGYPDLEYTDQFGRNGYIECKSYNIENINTTQRAFYLSPSEDFKVNCNAHHFVFSYEVYVVKKIGDNKLYKCRCWKIIDVSKLDVDVKYEFNSDNARMYRQELILAEGNLNF